MITYPHRINNYNITINTDTATLLLYGIDDNDINILVGKLHFQNTENLQKEFINRIGVINTSKPLDMLAPVLTLFHGNKNIYITEQGNIITSKE